jgi:phenylalanine-4-hydroxylase
LNTKHVYESLPLDEFGNASYTEIENKTWTFLLNRQNELIPKYAVKEFIDGVKILDFKNRIPQQHEVTKILNTYTGWGIEPVPAVIQPEYFFTLLANKKFPAANFIRIEKDIDYIMEPDVFHEVYGHCPLLTVKAYADFMEEFGKIALSCDEKTRRRLFRLFWFTIEFGLFKIDDEFKIYGGGILSSKSEVIYSATSEIPIREPLDPLKALLTPFRIDILQPKYFYIESYNDLYDLLKYDIVDLAKKSLALKDDPKLFEPKSC